MSRILIEFFFGYINAWNSFDKNTQQRYCMSTGIRNYYPHLIW